MGEAIKSELMVEVKIDLRNNKHIMSTIVQGNWNIYTISKGEADWQAGVKCLLYWSM